MGNVRSLSRFGNIASGLRICFPRSIVGVMITASKSSHQIHFASGYRFMASTRTEVLAHTACSSFTRYSERLHHMISYSKISIEPLGVYCERQHNPRDWLLSQFCGNPVDV